MLKLRYGGREMEWEGGKEWGRWKRSISWSCLVPRWLLQCCKEYLSLSVSFNSRRGNLLLYFSWGWFFIQIKGLLTTREASWKWLRVSHLLLRVGISYFTEILLCLLYFKDIVEFYKVVFNATWVSKYSRLCHSFEELSLHLWRVRFNTY